MLNTDDTSLVIIDVQEKLFRVMDGKEKMAENLQKLIKGALVLEIPIIITEQNPNGLGPTISEVAELIPDLERIPKFSFSCCGEERFRQELDKISCQNILIAGIESHVCVYQTAVDLAGLGYNVQVVANCVSSRNVFDNIVGLERVKAEGIVLTITFNDPSSNVNPFPLSEFILHPVFILKKRRFPHQVIQQLLGEDWQIFWMNQTVPRILKCFEFLFSVSESSAPSIVEITLSRL